MGKQYFLHVTNDHRVTKNQLEKELKKHLITTYNHTLTEDLKQTAAYILDDANRANKKFPRCKPLHAWFQQKRDFPGSSDEIHIAGLLCINFYEVQPHP